jgi:sigma-B regulation protein RsbU (phosphoserine phosphatase)
MWFLHILGTIRRHLATLGDPAAAISAVDRDLRLTGFEIPLTTLLVARLNLANGELTYCNAGHPPALLIGNSRVQELSLGGPVLGSISQAAFVNGTATVRTGDTLLAYSDGIVEARNRSGVEFGAAGLLRATACASSEPSEMLFSVLASVEDFLQSRHQEDDIALVVLHRFSS